MRIKKKWKKQVKAQSTNDVFQEEEKSYQTKRDFGDLFKMAGYWIYVVITNTIEKENASCCNTERLFCVCIKDTVKLFCKFTLSD